MSRRKNWIEQTNPLRWLTPATVVGYLEAGQRGELAMLMWLYHIIEQSDPDLLALVERRTSAVCEMDWNIGAAQPEEISPQSRGGRGEDQRSSVLNRWVTIGGRAVLVGEEGDQENPHSAKEQSAEIGKGQSAMRKVLATQGDAVAAVARGDIGPVSFYWGEPGNPEKKHSDGFGISKIVAKHGEATALKVPEIIVRGKLHGPYQGGTKRDIILGDYKAVITLKKEGRNEHWVLTAFERGGER